MDRQPAPSQAHGTYAEAAPLTPVSELLRLLRDEHLLPDLPSFARATGLALRILDQEARVNSHSPRDELHAALGALLEDARQVRRARALDQAQQVRAIEDFRAARDDAMRLAARLAEREQQLSELVGRLLAAQEDERRRVAYDIHDGLAQVAAAAAHRLDAFAHAYPPRAENARRDLERTRQLARQTVKEARRLIAGLRPTVLDDFGLATAVQQEAEILREDGREVVFTASRGTRRLPPTVETALYRVAQEALANIRRHAGPARAEVRLYRHDGSICLAVRDWGQGFDARQPRDTTRPGEQVGLAGMRERVILLGGTCEITSRPGHGTRVIARVPIPELQESR